jgi:hypothetical protein
VAADALLSEGGQHAAQVGLRGGVDRRKDGL